VVLADHEAGEQAMAAIEDHGLPVSHLFDASGDVQRRKRLKRRFWNGTPGVKGSTFHSFKGWEARAVVVLVTPKFKIEELVYVGLTRVKGDDVHRAAMVHVLNSAPELNSFDQCFERQLTVEEVAALGGQQGLDL
jgi:hypothetical protein